MLFDSRHHTVSRLFQQDVVTHSLPTVLMFSLTATLSAKHNNMHSALVNFGSTLCTFAFCLINQNCCEANKRTTKRSVHTQTAWHAFYILHERENVSVRLDLNPFASTCFKNAVIPAEIKDACLTKTWCVL